MSFNQKEYRKQYYLKNKEKRLALSKLHYKYDADVWRQRKLKHKFNISLEDYKLMLKNQNNKCKICKKEEVTKNRLLAVDHCHQTGKIRGLLCTSCNTKLGWYENNTDQIRKYLK
jgi:hypothetical protein